MLPSPKIATSLRPKARRRPMARIRSDTVSMGRATIRCWGWAVTLLKSHSVPAPKATNPRTRISTPTRRRPRNSASRRSAALRNSPGRRGAAAAREARWSRRLAVRAAIISEAVISVAVGGGSCKRRRRRGCCCWSIQPRTAGSCKRFRSCCTWGGGGFCVGGLGRRRTQPPRTRRTAAPGCTSSRAGALWSACVVIIETAIPQKTPVCDPAQERCTGATFCATSSWIAKKPPTRRSSS